MAAEFQNVRRVRRNRWWLGLSLVPWALAFLSIPAAIISGQIVAMAPLPHLSIIGALTFALAYKRNKHPRFESGKLAISETAVLFGDREVARREQLTGGVLLPKEGRVWVRLRRKGKRPAVLLDVATEAEGRAILRALQLDATQTVAELSGLSPYFALSSAKQMAVTAGPAAFGILGAMLARVAIGPLGAGLMIFAMMLMLLCAFVGMAMPTKISVGADGILTKWLRWRSYFAFSEVLRVDPIEQRSLNKVYLGVRITKRDGSASFLPIGQKGWGEEDFEATAERIREAIEVYKAGNVGANISVLARNGRAPKDWVTSLRRVGEGANADMRTAPVAADQLVRIVRDLGAAPLARASAAIALAARGSAEEREHIRVAAEATVAPKLRIAFEKAMVSEVDDEELGVLLSELEASEAT